MAVDAVSGIDFVEVVARGAVESPVSIQSLPSLPRMRSASELAWMKSLPSPPNTSPVVGAEEDEVLAIAAITRSRPGPAWTTSLPSPALMLSSPPSVIMSSPAPPLMMSLPKPPSSRSLPPSPNSVSSPMLAMRVSACSVPPSRTCSSPVYRR